jgi:hypothetical protein
MLHLVGCPIPLRAAGRKTVDKSGTTTLSSLLRLVTGPSLRQLAAYRSFGASDGIRTHDIHLGKVTLYQTELRSLPNGFVSYANLA